MRPWLTALTRYIDMPHRAQAASTGWLKEAGVFTRRFRDYAAAQQGMAAKSVEFRAGGSESYVPLKKS